MDVKKLFGALALFSGLLVHQSSFASSDNWWNNTVFYEIFVRSYQDSDGDGKGDFAGMLSRLDYLEELGVNGIWLMPINQSPSYHGYDVIDYYDTEQDYGSLSEFRTFLDSAHARGIKVIMDLVVNHCSSQHPWFQSFASGDTTYSDWFIHRPVNPGWIGPWGQQVWHALPGIGWYYALFWSEMPDLNWIHPPVQQKMYEIADFWLDSVGVDGFRLDAIKHLVEDGDTLENTAINHVYLKDFYDSYKNGRPEVFSVGEVWSDTRNVASYTPGEEIDACFEFELAAAINWSVNFSTGDPVADQMQVVLTELPPSEYATFLGNHDQNRIFDQYGQDWGRAKLAAGILMTLPGIPFVYYGDEIGMVGSGIDENKRKPMQWTSAAGAGFTSGTPWYSLNPDYTSKNVQAQQADPNSLWTCYRDLIHLRRERSALQNGSYAEVDVLDNSTLSYLREDSSESLLILANMLDQKNTALSLSLSQSNLAPGTYPVTDLLRNTAAAPLTVDAQGGFSNYQPFDSLEAQTVYVLALDETVGRTAPQNELNFSLGPNPVQDRLTIHSEGQPYTGRLLSLEGKVLQSFLHQGTSNGLDMSELPQGIYFLQLEQEGKQQSIKILKK